MNYKYEDTVLKKLQNTELDILVHNIAGNFWAEVDYIEDYERILNFVKKRKSENSCHND